jgi:hypothetical protein
MLNLNGVTHMKSLKSLGLIVLLSLGASQALAGNSQFVSKDSIVTIGRCIKNNPWRTAGAVLVGVLAYSLFYDLVIKKRPQKKKK